MGLDDKRLARVSERVQKELSAMISREVHDPRVVGVAVTGVRMSADLQIANVYVRLATTLDPDAKARKGAIAGLESASRMLRGSLGRRLGLPHAPKLIFRFDEGLERRQRIDALLDEVARAPKAIEEADDAHEEGDDRDERDETE